MSFERTQKFKQQHWLFHDSGLEMVQRAQRKRDERLRGKNMNGLQLVVFKLLYKYVDIHFFSLPLPLLTM